MKSYHAQLMTDCDLIAHLDAVETEPTDDDCAVMARLLMRYKGNTDVLDLLDSIMVKWEMDTLDLFAHTRQLWSSGYRPKDMADGASEGVGSGFDTEDKETK